MGYKNVLVPLDGSKIALNAIEDAVKLAKSGPGDGRIVLLAVVETPTMQFEGYGEIMGHLDIHENIHRDLKKLLDEEAAKINAQGVETKCLVLDGLPHEEIVGVCSDENINVVVMTTHGRTGIAHWIMGSVAERVVRAAPCSVFIVRRPDGEEKQS